MALADKTPEQQWDDFLVAAKLRDPDHRAFNTLIAAYASPARGYHNLDHIRHCLAMLDLVRNICPSVTAVEAAIWFHDAIYDATRTDNEELSADLALNTLKEMGASPEFTRQAHGLILDTRHQQPPDSPAGQYLADIDLTSLGLPPEQFDAHGRAIRQEYAHLDDAAYGNGRKTIFERFLSRPTIYYTDYFRTRFEAAARANMERALQQLRK